MPPKITDPSVTVSAKWLGFLVALYLVYKEVRVSIERDQERTTQFAWLQKDVESLKLTTHTHATK